MKLSLEALIAQYQKLYEVLIELNLNLQNLAIQKRQEISKKYSSWNTEKDARLSIFFRLQTAIKNNQFGITFVQAFLDPAKLKNLPIVHIESMFLEYDKFMRFSFFQFIFSQIESSIRIFMRAIDIDAYYKKKYPFGNIYSFIDNYLGLKKYNDLFYFLRLIRNSIHNNGMYFPDNQKEPIINYREKSHTFKIGKPISCGDWITLFNVTEDIVSALKEIIESKEISILNFIDDPVPTV